MRTMCFIRQILLLLSGMMLSIRFVSAGEVCYSRHDGKYWQIWSAALDGTQPRALTTTTTDKRSLHAVTVSRNVLCRDNEGRLNVMESGALYHIDRLFPGDDVIKDFDFDPQRGYLIATYAPNANDNIFIWWYAAGFKTNRLLIADPYLNEMPRWIPRSNRLVFVKSHRGKSQLHTADFNQPHPQPLFPNQSQSTTDPRPDPSGTLIAFCRQSDNASFDLWIAGVNGENPRELYAGPGLETDPSWSPDGQWILFATWDHGHFRIARIRPDGSQFSLVTAAQEADCRYPVWLTEGKSNP